MQPRELSSILLPMKVGVVIPAFQAESFIERAVRSVLAQSSVPDLIICVDDGSRDRTSEILERIAGESLGLVKLLKQPNSGAASARNLGIRFALEKGMDWVALLDADDFWEPTKLSKQLHVGSSSSVPNLGVIYSGYFEVVSDESGASKEVFQGRPKIRGFPVTRKLLRGNFVSGSASTALIRSEVFRSIGYFREDLRASEDWDFFLRASEEWGFDFSSDPLTTISRNRESNSSDRLRELSYSLMVLEGRWTIFLLMRRFADLSWNDLWKVFQGGDGLPSTDRNVSLLVRGNIFLRGLGLLGSALVKIWLGIQRRFD